MKIRKLSFKIRVAFKKGLFIDLFFNNINYSMIMYNYKILMICLKSWIRLYRTTKLGILFGSGKKDTKQINF